MAYPPTGAEEQTPTVSSEPSKKGVAVVYVIDTSSSMRWIFDDVRTTVKSAIDKCEPGTALSIIVFGDSAETLVSYKNMNARKKEIVSTLLDSISPAAVYTNLALALKLGTEALHKYYREQAADRYVLVLVSDGKNHPPPDKKTEYTIEQTFARFPDFIPGREWALYYIALESQIDPEVLALVKKHGGSFFDAEKIAKLSQSTEQEVIKSIIEAPDQWEIVPLISDHQGDVQIKRHGETMWLPIAEGEKPKVFAGDRVMVAPDSKAVMSFGSVGKVGIQEDTEISLEDVEKLPLEQSASVELRLEEGTLWNAVSAPSDSSLTYEILTPIALTGIRGTVFRLSFDPVKQEQNVAVIEGSAEVRPFEEKPAFEKLVVGAGKCSVVLPGQKPSLIEEIPHKFISEWDRWKEVLLRQTGFDSKGQGMIHICRDMLGVDILDCDAIGSLNIGPLRPGREKQEALSLEFDSFSAPEDLEVLARLDISPPPGVNCIARVVMDKFSQGVGTIWIIARAEKDAILPKDREWKGMLVLTSNSSSVSFAQNGRIPIKIFTETSRQARPYRLSSSLMAKINWKLLRRTGAILLLLAVLVGAGRIAKREIRARRFIPLNGWLIVLEKPEKAKIESIDLRSLSERVRKPSLLIGRSTAADLRLPHFSVSRRHASIRAGGEPKGSSLYLRRLGFSDTRVNFSTPFRETPVKDRDIIEVGAFQFLYSISHMQQVVVHYRNGVTRRGVLQTWNVDEDSFTLRPEDEPAGASLLQIRFKDLKGVFFVKDFDKEIARKMKSTRDYPKQKRITVQFRDGETIEGYTLHGYAPEARRFFVVPIAEGEEENTLCVLVERKFTRKVEFPEEIEHA